jgi:hypothetical protein
METDAFLANGAVITLVRRVVEIIQPLSGSVRGRLTDGGWRPDFWSTASLLGGLLA